jgi:hypothetical protein
VPADGIGAAAECEDFRHVLQAALLSGYIKVGPAWKLGPRQLLAHHVDLGIDREGRYRGVTGPPCEIGKTAAHEA